MTVPKRTIQNTTPKAGASQPQKPAVKWGVKLLRDKTAEALKAGGLPPSQIIANALILAASEHLDLEKLTAPQTTPLSDAARRVIMQAMEKAKFPGVTWESVLEPLLVSVWADKKRDAAVVVKPAQGQNAPRGQRPASKSGSAGGKSINAKDVRQKTSGAAHANGAKPAAAKPAGKSQTQRQAKPKVKVQPKPVAAPEVIVKKASKVLLKPN